MPVLMWDELWQWLCGSTWTILVLLSLYCVCVAHAICRDHHGQINTKCERSLWPQTEWDQAKQLWVPVYNSTCFCKQAASNAPWPESRWTIFRIKFTGAPFVVIDCVVKFHHMKSRPKNPTQNDLHFMNKKNEPKLCVVLFGLFPEDVVEICAVLCQVDLGAEVQWHWSSLVWHYCVTVKTTQVPSRCSENLGQRRRL